MDGMKVGFVRRSKARRSGWTRGGESSQLGEPHLEIDQISNAEDAVHHENSADCRICTARRRLREGRKLRRYMAIFTLKNTLFLIRSNQRCGRETRRGRIELIKIFGGRLRSPALVVPWRADGPLTGDHLVRVWESLALINLTARLLLS